MRMRKLLKTTKILPANGMVCRVSYTDRADTDECVEAVFIYGIVDEFMHEWMMRKQVLKYGIITDDEYLEWKLNWPDTCGKCEPKKGWRSRQ